MSVVLVWVPVYDGRIVAHQLSESGQHVVSSLFVLVRKGGGGRSGVCVWVGDCSGAEQRARGGGGDVALWLTDVVICSVTLVVSLMMQQT